jgi:hypothetical protein
MKTTGCTGLGKAFVKQGRRIAVSVVVWGMVLANTGVLHAVHLLPWSDQGDAFRGAFPCWRSQAAVGHDPCTCTLCLQFAAANKVLAGFAEPVAFSADVVTEAVFAAARPVQSVRLPSPAARAPPSVCS